MPLAPRLLCAALLVLALAGKVRAEAAPATRPARTEQRTQAADPAPDASLHVFFPESRISSVLRPQAPALLDPPAGGPRGMLEVNPAIGFAEEYTDNFDLATSGGRDNLRSTLSPGVEVLLGNGLATGRLDYRMDAIHDSVLGGGTLHHSALGEASWRATPRIELALSDAFVDSDDPGDADRLGLRNERRTFQRNNLSAEARYGGPMLSATAFYRIPSFLLEDGERTVARRAGARIQRSFDHDHVASLSYEHLASDVAQAGPDVAVAGHEIRLGWARPWLRGGSIGVGVSYALRTATSEAVPGTKNVRTGTDFGQGSILSSLELPLRPDLAATLSLGFSQLSVEPGERFSVPLAIGALRFQRGRLGAELSLAQGFSETFSDGENFGLVKTRGADGGLSYRLTPRVALRIAGFYRNNDFLGVVGDSSGHEALYGSSLRMTVTLRRRLELSLEYALTEFDPHRTGSTSYTDHRLRLSLRSIFE